MTEKNLKCFFKENYISCLKTISELSMTDDSKILVEDERKLYCFDDIQKIYHSNDKLPTSADSVLVLENKIFFIEYKTGFKSKINKESLDPQKLTCPKFKGTSCIDYGDLLLKIENLRTESLKDSLKLKAVESFNSFEKQILPICPNQININDLNILFCVVIDDYIESYEAEILDLANIVSPCNAIQQTRESLSRFRKVPCSNNHKYYYDDIKVFSPYQFISFLNEMNFQGQN